VEFFRGDYADVHLHNGFTPAHLLSVVIFVSGVVLFMVLRSRKSVVVPAN
jgi:hypothetical protein